MPDYKIMKVYLPVTIIFALNVGFTIAMPETAIAQSHQLMAQSSAAKNELERLIQRGDRALSQNNFKEAISIFQQASQLARQNQDLDSQVLILVGIGRSYDLSGQYLKAEQSFKESLQILSQLAGEFTSIDKRARQNRLKILAHSGLGIAYINIGEYTKASENLQLAVLLSNGEAKNTSLLIHFEPRFKLAELYQKQKKYQEAIAALQQARIVAQQIGDRRAEAMTLTAIGNNFMNLGQFNLASQFHAQAKALGNFPQEPEIANAPARSSGIVGDLVSVAGLLERLTPILQKVNLSIRKMERITANDSRFTVVGRTANNLDELMQNIFNLTPKLRQGDLMSAYPYLQKVNQSMTNLSRNMKDLNLLMEEVKRYPERFPALRQMNIQDIKVLQEIEGELRDLKNSIGKRSKELKKN
ncbi:tetratricopeptide repeat protein [Pseudanabaena sp. FACHB-1277]|uniref:Tetratricopeptide repeat protein n=1 Tax=Pseudanabaena cinerea FACHB-1277 TaxID=2949581 RepID=A0A926Z6V3_9CYAN|nr:tetratricopeptide repeat protein [Pseudanabaena cinerea]MBD2149134.1 tetratricopeptide repeat protein [Pseudanabaena cinerea FACHB-1277]